MELVVLGAYPTQADAETAMAGRREPQNEMRVVNDGFDPENPWRIYWERQV